MKNIVIRRRRGKWGAHWRRADGVGLGRYGDTPELALIHLIAAEGPGNSSIEDGVVPLFEDWAHRNGLGGLRTLLLVAKGDGWDGQRNLWAVKVYREWRREQTSGTSLGLEELVRYVCSGSASRFNGEAPVF